VCLFVLASRLDCLGAPKTTFLDSGQSDAAVIQIGRTAGEPFTLIVDGGDGDNDLKNNLPALLSQDPTIELVILSHPHKDHVGALDWLITSGFLSGGPTRPSANPTTSVSASGFNPSTFHQSGRTKQPSRFKASPISDFESSITGRNFLERPVRISITIR